MLYMFRPNPSSYVMLCATGYEIYDAVSNLTQEEMKDLMEYKDPDEELITYRTIDGIYNARKDINVPEAILPYLEKPFDALDLCELDKS